jgi:hypothetical protein
MCGRRNVARVERRHLGSVIQDDTQLLHERLELVVGEREPGELGDVLDIGAGETRHLSSLEVDVAWLRCRFVATYTFLSDDWFAEVDRIVDAIAVEVPTHADLSMNLVVTETPFGEDRLLHIGTHEGRAAWGRGHLDGADLTLTTDYLTAREILVSANPQTGMQAFMEGKVKVQGDLTKLMAAQVAGTGPGAPALAGALAEITELAT